MAPILYSNLRAQQNGLIVNHYQQLMPLRPDLLTKRWSTVEFPILPFLAPRVFAPWPSNGRRAYTGAQPIQRPSPTEIDHNISSLRSEEARQAHRSSDFSLRRQAGKEARQTADDGRTGPSSSWGNLSKTYGVGDPNNASDASPGPSLDADFRRKYEEIWGTEQEVPSVSNQVQDETRRFRYARRAHRNTGPDEEERSWLSKQQDRISHEPEGGESQYNQLQHAAHGGLNRGSSGWPSGGKHLRQAQDQARDWRTRFALLQKRENGSSNNLKLQKLLNSGIRGTDSTLLEALINSDSSSSLREVWEALPRQKRKSLWPKLMLSTLNEHPTKALKFLAATDVYPYPPGYAVGDTFNYIVSYYLHDRTTRNPRNAFEIFRLLKHMLQTGPQHHFHIRQLSIYLLLQNLEGPSVGELFQTLTKLDHKLHKNTLSHFSSKLRLSGGSDERMELLERLWQEGADFNSPEVISVCVTILQLKNRTSEVASSDSEIFAYMLECGMMPNIVIYNVLLQNSLEGGDHETGWQIHDMMVENGIDTDAYTYSLLLSDAKLRNDQPSIERVITLVSAKGIRNAHIVNDLLHIILIFRKTYNKARHWDEQKGRPSNTFARMLFIYRQYFHLEPLTRLIPWLEDSNPDTKPVSKETLMDAPVPTLVVMLTAFLRQSSDPGPVVQFYNHFCSLVQAGDPIATSLSKSTHVYNIILKALGSFQKTLALCPRLIGDMLSHTTAASADRNQDLAATDQTQSSNAVYKPAQDESETSNYFNHAQTLSETSSISTMTQSSDVIPANVTPLTPLAPNQPGIYPKPDVHTWSVLLKAFMNHGQPRAAEKVLTMMKDRKVWPNEVTWNSLIIGYARMQDMSMTVDAVSRLQRAGFGLDAVALKGLAYFHNRRALIEAMKASEASDPGRSISKRPAAIGLARSALNKTLRLVERDGLEPAAEVAEDPGETDIQEPEDVSSKERSEKKDSEGELIVGDVPLVHDVVLDLDTSRRVDESVVSGN